MADLKFPAVFLGLDDVAIDAWYSTFIESNVKATFNPTNLASLKDPEWEKLRNLEAAGHTIGFHGVNHVRAGVEISKHGAGHFLATEIMPGIKMFEEQGLKRPLHYTYPRGNRTIQSDSVLLGIFRTLRAGGIKIYAKTELQGKLFAAANWRLNHGNLIRGAIAKNGAVFVYLHTPMPDRLASLWRFKDAVNFYPMDALNA